jgi:hypothetical protein
MADDALQEERRHFSRILFNAECTLSQGGLMWTSDVQDISLKGVLIRKPEAFTLDGDRSFEAKIKLAGDQQIINMTLVFTNEHNDGLGFKCAHIDIDSMTHLKRLVELNLGDESLLQRELGALSSTH